MRLCETRVSRKADKAPSKDFPKYETLEPPGYVPPRLRRYQLVLRFYVDVVASSVSDFEGLEGLHIGPIERLEGGI